MELVVYLKNEKDLAVLEPLLKRMKLRFDMQNGNGKKTKPASSPKSKPESKENLTDRVKELRAQLPPPPSKEKRAAALARMDELRKQIHPPLPPRPSAEKVAKARAAMDALLEEGVDVSAYGDPIEWQRETRKDRELPFRNDD